jgi:anti-sigma factor RsiW
MSIDDIDLLAYVDGHLPHERRAQVEAAVAASSALASRLRAMQASVLPYGSAFHEQPLPDVPPELSARIAGLIRADQRARPQGRSFWPLLSASFAAGALCCAVVLKLLPDVTPMAPSTAQVLPWIKAVADYQQLYSRETLANVTENRELSERVLGDLRASDGIALRVPDLRAEGLTFKRVQRLSFHHEAVVQMVYLPEHGEPVAVCVIADAGQNEAPHAQRIGELNTVTWRRDNLGYVLLGKDSADALADVARRLASGDNANLYDTGSRPGGDAAA